MKLTEQDIISIAQSGEGYNAEFKISVPSKVRELAGEVCAFANAAGGVLLLGVDDENKIQGIEINNSKRSAIQDALTQLNPHLHCPFYFVEVNGKQIGVIDIPSGLQKPYTVSGAIFIRQGANSQKITSVEQMRDFFQQSGRIYFDEGSCNGFLYEKDFDIEFFKEFRIVADFSPAVDDLQILRNLKLYDVENNFKNGSVLFFGKKPETFFDTAVIRCVAFENTDKVQIFDDKIFGGPLLNQYREAMHWLKQKLNIRYIIEGGGPRKEQWEIPEDVFKESLINALSHRDYYDRGGKIMVELFDDRVEITNPGGLVSAIKPDEFGTKSHSRNPLIFGLFNRMNMVEQVGSGIGRISRELKKHGHPKPVYKTDGLFTVIFQRPMEKEILKSSQKSAEHILDDKYGINTGYLRDKYGISAEEFGTIAERLRNDCGTIALDIYILMCKNPNIKTNELALETTKSIRTVENYISKLKKSGFIERKGPKLGGYWVINIV